MQCFSFILALSLCWGFFFSYINDKYQQKVIKDNVDCDKLENVRPLSGMEALKLLLIMTIWEEGRCKSACYWKIGLSMVFFGLTFSISNRT